MKRLIALSAGLLGCLVLVAGASRLAAQTGAPSESDIGRALRPAPQGLGEHQGLPTLGTAPRPQESPNVHSTSTGASLARPSVRPRRHRPGPGAATASQAPSGTQPAPSVTFNTIEFAFNSAQLTPGSTETLRNLGNALNHELADQKSFLIEGHTDASGGLQYNMVLSRRRADAVKDYLVQDTGVAPARLQTIGKGPTEPITGRDPYAPENRRVVVINLGG
ncbi:MAG TPA: OmpA family protein [Stellaceae bacterium]|jgi:outer membrane protein OmpA-like peptidoglycan-associated protein